MLESFFYQIIHQSIMGTSLILAVVFVRFLLKKKGQPTCFLLWSLVFLRLSLPFTVEIQHFESIERKVESITTEVVFNRIEEKINENSSSFTTKQEESSENADIKSNILPSNFTITDTTVDEKLDFLQVTILIWLFGIGVMWVYFLYSTVKLRKKLRYASKIEDNIYALDHIQTAFVWGIVKPNIYLPSSMTEEEKNYILPHEQYHIKRFDHIFLLFSYISLSFHWFNPFVWLAYVLSGKDMELSVDETIVAEKGVENLEFRGKYAQTLLIYATKQKLISPLHFGQGDVKERICNVMKFKQKNSWISRCTTAFILATLVACSGENKGESTKNDTFTGNSIADSTETTSASNGSLVDYYEYDQETLELKWKDELEQQQWFGYLEEFFTLFGNQDLVKQMSSLESMIWDEFGLKTRVFSQNLSGKEYIRVLVSDESRWIDLNGEEIPSYKEVDTPNILTETIDFVQYNEEIQHGKNDICQVIADKIEENCIQQKINYGITSIYYTDMGGLVQQDYGNTYPLDSSFSDLTIEQVVSGDYFITGLFSLSKEERNYPLLEEFIAKTEKGDSATLQIVWLKVNDYSVDLSSIPTSDTHSIFYISDIYFENGLYTVKRWEENSETMEVEYYSSLIQEYNEASHIVFESGMETFTPASLYIFLAHDPRAKSSDTIWTDYEFLFMEQL